MTTLIEALGALADGSTTASALVDEALVRAEDPSGEGARIYLQLFSDRARAQAQAVDAARARGDSLPPLAGVPISVKDLFDIEGQVTTAGSIVARDNPPATADAPVVSRLRAAGAIVVGRTNMTEFAFSGIGINPHYGTPANPFDRSTARVPGGSSSGAAVSVTDGTALAAIGTDTGGSVRIPSALCGLTGFKPTARRIPTDRCYPLSWTLDSIGPLGHSAADCALLDRIMAGLPATIPTAFPAKGLRLGIVRDLLFDDVEDAILRAFDRAVSRLSAAGAVIFEVDLPELSDLPHINRSGGIASAEAYHIHREHFEQRSNELDRRVAKRVGLGKSQSADDYMTHFDERRRIQSAADHATAPLDAILAPTTARTAPPIAELEASDDVFFQYNGLMLRNPSTFNFLDRCGFSLPIHEAGDAPIGLMVIGETMGDDHLLSVGLGIEAALKH